MKVTLKNKMKKMKKIKKMKMNMVKKIRIKVKVNRF